jgi:hypothetical protein
METHKNGEAPTTVQLEEQAELITVVETASGAAAEDQQVAKTAQQIENKARLVIGGLVAAAIVSIIAVLVAGIFQLVSSWMSCKPNLPISDPARMHWSELISDKITTASTGVPKELEDQARLKGLPLSTEAEGRE